MINNHRDNHLRDNVSHDNAGYGIRVQGTGSFGNTFEDNRMFGNGLADARDDTDPNVADGIQLLSTWIDTPAPPTCPTTRSAESGSRSESGAMTHQTHLAARLSREAVRPRWVGRVLVYRLFSSSRR